MPKRNSQDELNCGVHSHKYVLCTPIDIVNPYTLIHTCIYDKI